MPIESLLPADSPRSIAVDNAHVHKLMTMGELPPIIVHRDTMRVVDGMHRIRAAKLSGRTEINVRFFEGTPAEAFVLAVRSNTVHGLELPHRDRVAAAKRIMATFPEWSNRAVAGITALSAKTVAKIRRTSEDIPHSNTRIGLDGRARPVDAADGRRRAAEFIAVHPHASLREIASAAGISLGTARDVRSRLGSGEDLIALSNGGGAVIHPRPVPARRAESGADADRGGNSEPKPAPQLADSLAILSRDPSVRHSESGRLLLRLLDNRTLVTSRRDQIIGQLPLHVRPQVRDAIQQCVVTWQRFVAELDTAIEGETPQAS